MSKTLCVIEPWIQKKKKKKSQREESLEELKNSTANITEIVIG